MIVSLCEARQGQGDTHTQCVLHSPADGQALPADYDTTLCFHYIFAEEATPHLSRNINRNSAGFHKGLSPYTPDFATHTECWLYHPNLTPINSNIIHFHVVDLQVQRIQQSKKRASAAERQSNRHLALQELCRYTARYCIFQKEGHN